MLLIACTQMLDRKLVDVAFHADNVLFNIDMWDRAMVSFIVVNFCDDTSAVRFEDWGFGRHKNYLATKSPTSGSQFKVSSMEKSNSMAFRSCSMVSMCRSDPQNQA